MLFYFCVTWDRLDIVQTGKFGGGVGSWVIVIDVTGYFQKAYKWDWNISVSNLLRLAIQCMDAMEVTSPASWTIFMTYVSCFWSNSIACYHIQNVVALRECEICVWPFQNCMPSSNLASHYFVCFDYSSHIWSPLLGPHVLFDFSKPRLVNKCAPSRRLSPTSWWQKFLAAFAHGSLSRH